VGLTPPSTCPWIDHSAFIENYLNKVFSTLKVENG